MGEVKVKFRGDRPETQCPFLLFASRAGQREIVRSLRSFHQRQIQVCFKMKTELLCIMILIACLDAASKDGYTTRYDHINLDYVLSNNRLLKHYYKCMMGVGSCPAEASKLRKYFPDILKTKCQKCTPLQKKKIRRTIEFLQKNKPEIWEGLLKRYDPTRELTKNMLTDPNFLGRP